VEHVLLDFAEQHDPETLGRHAKRVSAALDQNGVLGDHERAARRRSAELRRFPDGSGVLIVHLTAEAAEYVETGFDTLGKPAPAEDGARDPRTPGQRRHDALLTALKIAFASGRLPNAGGCPTTLLLKMDVANFATNTGVATTGHGYPIPVSLAKNWLHPETRAILTLLSKTRGILAYSRQTTAVHRTTTPSPCWPETAAAPTPVVMPRWAGSMPTTSPITPPPNAPASTTAPWSAAPTTTPSNAWAGPRPCSTADPTGSHPTGSTSNENPSATTCTIDGFVPAEPEATRGR
jgi:hypothetical protein